jgi:glyoxylase-like metal-dependent hydrolase (beta-lactamase superfamily II)
LDKWKRVAPAHVTGRTRFQEVPKYDEGLYDLGNEIYAWMVPNGSWGESNAGLLVGNGESLLIDTLWDLKYTRAMLDAMKPRIQGNPIRVVVNTHADGDHWWGNELVADAEIISSLAARDEMNHIKPVSMILLGRILGKFLSFLGAARVGHWFQNMVLPYDFKEVSPKLPTRTFEGKLDLSVGGRNVQLIQVGPAHTRGDVMVYIPAARTLFCGDIVFLGSTPVMWAGPVENILAALNQILGMDVDIIVPGHGPVTDKSGVRQVLSYWEYVHEEAYRRFAAGMSAGEAAQDIVLSEEFSKQPFARWNSPERMMSNLHTLYRHFKGRTASPGIPALLNIMRKQAMLAHRLPNAEPMIMRKVIQ